MIYHIIQFAVRQKLLIGLFVAGLVAGGLYALTRLPIDAVPDITNNQVQIVSVSASLAPQEVEQFITYPIEVAMANLPYVQEIRSISRFGLSVVTIVFEERVPVLEARQYVKEQLTIAESEIPAGLTQPELMPITTGLGEIYQYVLRPEPGYESRYDPMKLRTIQDWLVKRQLAGTPGIIEVSSFGGYLKQYEIAINPLLLQAHKLSLTDVYEALEANNQNSGGSYIERGPHAYYIRTEGVVKSLDDLRNIVVENRQATPILVRDLGQVRLGWPKRFGAMTMDGKGEAVGGITLMLKGANSSQAIRAVHERIEDIRKTLPEGLRLVPYLDRSDLVSKTIRTVRNNLLEGGVIVILVLILLLGNWRAGLIVASIIPLAMLFAISLMGPLGITANLMSLGAIDFGIVVDGAVIIVEGVLHGLVLAYAGQKLVQEQMDQLVIDASTRLFRSAFFGILIILVVFIPVMTLTGIEGRMFRPMALTFSLVILGALILSLTYVPMMASLILSKNVKHRTSFSDRLMAYVRGAYIPTLSWSLRNPWPVLVLAMAMFGWAVWMFPRLGAEFLPTLEEGDLAMQMTITPGSSLQQSIATSSKAEKVLLANFPEIEHVVSKIGTAEVPTDPMAIEDADIMIVMKERSEWVSASDREGLVAKMKAALDSIDGAEFEFTQPIQLRFNELLSGSKSDLAVKIFGEDTDSLKMLADKAGRLIRNIPGAADVRVEQTEGLQQLVVKYDRQKIAQYGLDIRTLNTVVRAAYAGEVAGSVFESERRFDLVLRLDKPWRDALELGQLHISLPDGGQLPLTEVAQTSYVDGPAMVSRENTRRRIIIGVNVRGRDLASLVSDIQQKLHAELQLPPGYFLEYGGDFENLQNARRRLAMAVPVALLLIFLLLYFAFGQIRYALLILSAVPLSAIGGVAALWIRGLPFSISAGVGFIALFGVAVLNGIVLISYFNQLAEEKKASGLYEIITLGAIARLRPVLVTAIVAALGFVPMALSHTNGAEVQRPLATVVIGGLISATLLTLVVLPVLYALINRRRIHGPSRTATTLILLPLLVGTIHAQQANPLSLEELIQVSLAKHPEISNRNLDIQIAELESETAKYVAPTILSTEIGEINNPVIDYRVNILQPIGPFFLNKAKRELGSQRKNLAQATYALSREELAYRIRVAWNEWLYKREVLAVYEQQFGYYQELAERANLQYESGERSRLELDMNLLKRSLLAKALESARLETSNARDALLSLAARPPTTKLAPEPLGRLPFPDTGSVGELQLAPFREQVEVGIKAEQVARKKANPKLALGYFIQSIKPFNTLQGGLVELQVPLFRYDTRARIEQSILRQEIARQDLSLKETRLNFQLRQSQRTAEAWQTRLTEAELRLTGLVEELTRRAEQQYSAGEITYFEFYQVIEQALGGQLQYLQTVFHYNQAVLRLSFLYR